MSQRSSRDPLEAPRLPGVFAWAEKVTCTYRANGSQRVYCYIHGETPRHETATRGHLLQERRRTYTQDIHLTRSRRKPATEVH